MPTSVPPTAPSGPRRELSGRAVLIAFVAFFAVVAAANAIMLRAATSTFGGVEASSYRAGLAFKNEIAAARAQDGSGWKVDVKLARETAGDVRFDLSALDGKGARPANLTASVRFSHPNDARRDRAAPAVLVAPGAFRGFADISPGQWDLVIELHANGERVFRSKSRVIIR